MEHVESFLSRNLTVIVVAIAVLLASTTVFFATGRRKPREPREPLGWCGDRGLSSDNWDTRYDAAAPVITGQGVKRGRRADGGERATAGNPILLALTAIAAIALIAAGIIAFAMLR